MKNLLQFCFIYYKIEEVTDRRVLEKGFRACLKKHSRNLHAPLCGIFCPNSVAVARYGALIRTKSPTNCDAHLAESLFQTRSRKIYNPKFLRITFASSSAVPSIPKLLLFSIKFFCVFEIVFKIVRCSFYSQ